MYVIYILVEWLINRCFLTWSPHISSVAKSVIKFKSQCGGAPTISLEKSVPGTKYTKAKTCTYKEYIWNVIRYTYTHTYTTVREIWNESFVIFSIVNNYLRNETYWSSLQFCCQVFLVDRRNQHWDQEQGLLFSQLLFQHFWKY